jgi:DNA-binding beta-propeller fold protein YncE
LNASPKPWFGGLVVALLSLLSITAAHAQIFVTNEGNNTIGEFDATTGAAINASLVSSGLHEPFGIAIS